MCSTVPDQANQMQIKCSLPVFCNETRNSAAVRRCGTGALLFSYGIGNQWENLRSFPGRGATESVLNSNSVICLFAKYDLS